MYLIRVRKFNYKGRPGISEKGSTTYVGPFPTSELATSYVHSLEDMVAVKHPESPQLAGLVHRSTAPAKTLRSKTSLELYEILPLLKPSAAR